MSALDAVTFLGLMAALFFAVKAGHDKMAMLRVMLLGPTLLTFILFGMLAPGKATIVLIASLPMLVSFVLICTTYPDLVKGVIRNLTSKLP